VAGWLRAKDASRRQRALAAVAAGAAADVGDLLRLMADDNPDVRAAAACAVGAARPDAAKAVPALAALLKDEDRFVCQSAADALSPYGPAAKPAVKELLAALADRNFDHDYRPHRAAAAAEAILRISADKDATRQALRLLTSDRMLADERPDSEGTVAAAARSLARCGPAAAPALPTLGRHLTHRLPAVRAAAAEAVLRVGGSDQERATALVTLAELLEKGDTAGRCAASRSAGRCGEAASDLRPALRRLLDDPEPEVRAAAKAALDRQ
jgi:HEAT repeat protein